MNLAQAEKEGLISRSVSVTFRAPRPGDAVAVHDLIGECPPLDSNSLYANLLQCTHFSQTCALAQDDEGVLAWVSGYLLPEQPEVYFLWQVAAHPRARGRGVPMQLITAILKRRVCSGVTRLATTITADNSASWKLFSRVSQKLGAPMGREHWFDRDRHFAGRHDSEHLVTIGPIPRPLPAP